MSHLVKVLENLREQGIKDSGLEALLVQSANRAVYQHLDPDQINLKNGYSNPNTSGDYDKFQRNGNNAGYEYGVSSFPENEGLYGTNGDYSKLGCVNLYSLQQLVGRGDNIYDLGDRKNSRSVPTPEQRNMFERPSTEEGEYTTVFYPRQKRFWEGRDPRSLLPLLPYDKNLEDHGYCDVSNHEYASVDPDEKKCTPVSLVSNHSSAYEECDPLYATRGR